MSSSKSAEHALPDDIWEMLNDPDVTREALTKHLDTEDESAAHRAFNVQHAEKKAVEPQCPVCMDDMGKQEEELRWCKKECGRTIHNICLDFWWAECAKAERPVTFPLCRTSAIARRIGGERQIPRC
jgi:hypothetical protein